MGINTCNTVVDRAPLIEGMDEVTKNQRVAEVTRAPESDVYDQIISDLEFAVDSLLCLLNNQTRAGLPMQQQKCYSRRCFLTRRYKDFAASDDFERAASLAESVINDYNFQLLDEFEMIFDNDNEENEEIIWAVQYDKEPLLNGWGNRSHLYYCPWYETYSNGLIRNLEPGYGRPWVRFNMTPFTLENFRPLEQDSRYERSFQDTWYYIASWHYI